jgi:hypothetical protein
MDERFTGIHRGGCVMSVFSIESDNMVGFCRGIGGVLRHDV